MELDVAAVTVAQDKQEEHKDQLQDDGDGEDDFPLEVEASQVFQQLIPYDQVVR